MSVAPSSPTGTIHRETSVAADPREHEKLTVAAYMELYPTTTPSRPCAFSIRGLKGDHWSVGTTVPTEDRPGLNSCSDPSVATDGAGHFYFVWLEQNAPAPKQFPTGDIRVARSSQRMPWFQDPVTVVEGGPQDYLDKPFIAVDDRMGSPYQGNVYVTV